MKISRPLAVAVTLLMLTVGLIPLLQGVSEAPRGPVNNTDSEPNDTRADATVIDMDVTVEGTLYSTDHHDNYKFQLAAGELMTVDVVFDGKLPLVSVYMRDENGFLLDFMRDTKNTDLYAVGYSVVATLYYLNITDDLLQGASYNATFTKTTVAGFAADGDDSPSEAIDVATFPYNVNTSADGDTEPTDHQDFYRVNLKRTLTKADLLVAHMTQEGTAQFIIDVYFDTFKTVEAYERTDDPKVGANYTYSYGAEAAGNYYVRVWAANGTGWYDLTLDVVNITLNDENDKPENATPIVLVGNHTATFSGDVGEDLDLSDYYSLEVMEGQVINASITSLDYSADTRLPKMHITFLESDGGTPYDVDPNMTDNLIDPDGYTNATATETGTNINYIRVFVDNVASGGGAYTVDLFTDRKPLVEETLIHEVIINESTIDHPSSDTSIKLAQLFSDPDPVDDLTYSYEIASEKGMEDPENMSITIGTDADRTLTLSPKPGQVGASGWKGSGELTLIATDPYGLNATATFLVRVTGTNHAPYLIYPYNETREANDSVVLTFNVSEINDEINLNAFFDDIDLGDILNFEVNASSPEAEEKDYGYSSVQDRYYLKSATINESFKIAFDLKSNLIDHKGSITIRFADTDKVKTAREDRLPLEEEVCFWAIDDGIPQKESECVKLIIQATSPDGTPPKWTQSFNKLTLTEDTEKIVDFDLHTSDIDPQDQTTKTYTVSNTTANITVEKVDRNHFRFVPATNWYGTIKDVKLNCTDTFGLSKEHTITIEVISVPDPPVKGGATPSEDATLTIDEAGSQVFHIDVSDVDSDLSDDLAYNWSIDGIWLRTIVGDTYTYLASYDAAGTHTIRVNVSERANPDLFITANWTITVNNVNRGPENVDLVEPTDGHTYKVKTLVPFRASSATDPDGDTLTYTWKVDGQVVSNSRTFDSKDLKKGERLITLEVTDGDIMVPKSVNITIKAEDTGEEPLDNTMILMLIIIMVIIIVVAMVAMRGKKEKPVRDEGPDIYAADKAAMKDAMKKADKKEEEEEESSEEE